MGSRSKRKIIQKVYFESYQALSINEKINFKWWWYWYGRQRLNLKEIFEMFASHHPNASIELLKYQSNNGTYVLNTI